MDGSPDSSPQATDQSGEFPAGQTSHDTHAGYWRSSLKIVIAILVVWASVSLGCGIAFRGFLDASMPRIGGAPFGFWMAQQGAIIGFLVLLVVYMILMNGLDRKHGYGEGSDE